MSRNPLAASLRGRIALAGASAVIAGAIFLGPVAGASAQGVGGLCKAPEPGRAATGCVPKPPVPGSHLTTGA